MHDGDDILTCLYKSTNTANYQEPIIAFKIIIIRRKKIKREPKATKGKGFRDSFLKSKSEPLNWHELALSFIQ